MLHLIKSVNPQPDLKLCVQFKEGITKIYDVRPLLSKWKAFKELEEDAELFSNAYVDILGSGVIWNERLDLSSDTIWEDGIEVKTPFDNLMAFSDATHLWGLNESTLRKAVAYGKLKNGVDVCKFGKQWIITMEAMRREYGEPLEEYY